MVLPEAVANTRDPDLQSSWSRSLDGEPIVSEKHKDEHRFWSLNSVNCDSLPVIPPAHDSMAIISVYEMSSY